MVRRFRGRADAAEAQGGFTVIELMAAISVLAIGFIALAGSMGLGLRQVGLARQRQTAAEIANARLEHLRNLPYELVALSTKPVYNSDTDDPDHDVNGEYYEVPGPAGQELMIVDASAGQLLHFEDPVNVGATEMKIYQYVTWVDDPDTTGAEDYKRVSIAVIFKFPSVNGVTRFVRAAAFVTTQTVVVNGAAAEPEVGTSPSPSIALPSLNPDPDCVGDTSAPDADFSIASGSGSETGYTASTQVLLGTTATDPCTPITVQFSNDAVTWGPESTMTTQVENFAWTIPEGDGTKNIWARFRDANLNTTLKGPLVIVLDTIKPSAPGTLTHTKSCQGTSRTVNLSWGVSNDTNFRGYRVYRSINGEAWEAIGTVSTTNSSDTHPKNLDSVRYHVVGYDKAGNESDASNIVSLNKNQC